MLRYDIMEKKRVTRKEREKMIKIIIGISGLILFLIIRNFKKGNYYLHKSKNTKGEKK